VRGVRGGWGVKVGGGREGGERVGGGGDRKDGGGEGEVKSGQRPREMGWWGDKESNLVVNVFAMPLIEEGKAKSSLGARTGFDNKATCTSSGWKCKYQSNPLRASMATSSFQIFGEKGNSNGVGSRVQI